MRSLHRIKYAELTDEMVLCRMLGHAWDDVTGSGGSRGEWQPRKGWGIVLRCIRCHTERYDTYSVVGEVLQRQYVYPDGYSALSRDAAKRHLVRMEFRARQKNKRLRVIS